MASDFRAERTRTNSIISSGSSPTTKPLFSLYHSTSATNFTGGTVSGLFDGVGTDVYSFFSGSKNHKNVLSSRGVTLFGGDVVVSGTLYADKQVIEIEESVTGSLTVSGSLVVSQSIEAGQHLHVNSSNGAIGYANFGTTTLGLGYGFRAASGVMQFKNSGGAWSTFGASGGGANDVGWMSPRAGAIITTGSVGITGSLVVSGAAYFGSHAGGSDIAFFVSGSVGGQGGADRGVSLFGGDIVTSGTLYIEGTKQLASSTVDAALFINNSGGTEAAIVWDSELDSNYPDAMIYESSGDFYVSSSGRTHVVGANYVRISARDFQYADFTNYFSQEATLFNMTNQDIDFRVSNQSFDGAIWVDASENLVSIDRKRLEAIPGGDINFYVSGGIGGGDLTIPRGVSLFGGDLVVSGGLQVDVNTFKVDQSTNRVGVGTNAPNAKMNITSDASGETLVSIEQHNNNSDAPNLEFVKSRGTYATPVVITSGDFLGDIQFKAYDGNSEDQWAGFFVQTYGTVSDTSHPAKIVVRACEDGSTVPSTAAIFHGGAGGTISGSIHETRDGVSYLVAGTNVTIASASSGQVTISSTGGASIWTDAGMWVYPTTNESVVLGGTTMATADIFLGSTNGDADFNKQKSADGDFRIRSVNSDNAFFVDANSNGVMVHANSGSFPGTNANFFVSGSPGGYGVGVFGGDLVVSGTIFGRGISGGAISGSLTRTVMGKSYLAAGSGVAISSASDGQITISSTATSAEWTDGGSFLYPADALGVENIVIGGTSLGTADILLGSAGSAEFNKQASAGQEFVVSTVGKSSAIHVRSSDNTVDILSGSGVTGGDGADISFFVSGAIGKQGSNTTKGTSLFGGDLVTSGALHVRGTVPVVGSIDAAIVLDASRESAIVWDSNVDTDYPDAMIHEASNKLYLSASSGIQMNGFELKLGDTGGGTNAEMDFIAYGTTAGRNIMWDASNDRFFVDGMLYQRNGNAIFNQASGDFDFTVETQVKNHALHVDSGLEAVFLMAKSTDILAAGSDVALFVSGTMGSKGTSVRGTTLFGGDMQISGALHIGGSTAVYESGESVSIILNSRPTVSDTSRIVWDTNADGAYSPDAQIYETSGDLYLSASDDVRIRGEFGDVVVECADDVMVRPGDRFTITEDAAASGKFVEVYAQPSAATFHSVFDIDGSNGIIINDAGESAYNFRVETNNKTHAFFTDAGLNKVSFLSGSGVTGGDGSDIAFFVSGAIGGHTTSGSNGIARSTATFGGDVVISGSMRAKQLETWRGGYVDGDTDPEFIPLTYTTEQGAAGYRQFATAPFGGRLVKLVWRSENAQQLPITATVFKGTNGDSTTGTALESVTVAGLAAFTTHTFYFQQNTHFNEGDIVAIEVNPSSIPGAVSFSAVFEMDMFV